MKIYKKISFQLIILLSFLLTSFGIVLALSYFWLTETKQSIDYLSNDVLDANKSTFMTRNLIDDMSNQFSKNLSKHRTINIDNFKTLADSLREELNHLERQTFPKMFISKDGIKEIRERFNRYYGLMQKIQRNHNQIANRLKDLRKSYKQIDKFFDSELQKALLANSSKPFSGINSFFKKHSNTLTFLKNITPHLEVYSTNANLLKKVQSALDMEINVDETFVALEGYISYPEKGLRIEFEDAVADFKHHESIFLKENLSPKEKKWCQHISDQYSKSILKSKQIMNMVDSKLRNLNSFEDQYNHLIKVINKISIAPILSKTAQIKMEMDERYTNMKAIVFVALIILLSICALAVLYIFRSVVFPLNKIVNIVSKSDINNLPESIPVKIDNEVGITAQSIENMINRLKNEISEKENAQKQMYLHERLASIGELAAGMAHEINNPLSIVRLSIDDLEHELQKNGTNNHDAQNEIKLQKEAIERISNIIKSLKHYTHMDLNLTEEVHINEAINDTITLLTPILKKEGISINLKLNDVAVSIQGNTGKFKQVLMNLTSNARDAVKDFEKKEITIETFEDSNFIYIEVKDTGCGIETDELDKVCNLFYTSKAPGKGSGMGLSISQKFINEMNGELLFESPSNKGATVTIKLPQVKKD